MAFLAAHERSVVGAVPAAVVHGHFADGQLGETDKYSPEMSAFVATIVVFGVLIAHYRGSSNAAIEPVFLRLLASMPLVSAVVGWRYAALPSSANEAFECSSLALDVVQLQVLCQDVDSPHMGKLKSN